MRRHFLMAGLALLCAGCSGADEAALGGVSQGEADALNKAAEMLDQPVAGGSIATAPRAEQKAATEK